ncbi:MAG TPA: 2OG-Fe(II) oxygenase, partial [Sphingomicrobium sp.]
MSEIDVATGFLDADSVSSKGLELAERYRLAKPFPHIVIDDFLPPAVLEMCLKEFERPQPDMKEYNAATERRKREYKPDLMSPGPRALFYGFNSLPFIRLLENITGIQGLI